MKDGKLFGKINIIDLIVILIAIAAVVVVALKKTGRLGEVNAPTGTSIFYTVQVENIPPEVYESAKEYIAQGQAQGKPGDQLMASGELLNGYVTNVTAKAHPGEAEVRTSTGITTVQAGYQDRLDLVFEVQAYVDNNVKTELGTQEVRAGKTHIVKTTHFELQYGTILTCRWEDGTGAGF